ncbi:MAG TPA: CBS domain-containing protein [Solirubrobacteraceae bacterium]|nr:CBS domain-containing protein [Solirubrobacteraceae bacterium]
MTITQTPLSRIRVRDVMHTGILTTDAETPLRTVAGLMARQHLHAIAVADRTVAERPYAFVTAIDVARAAAEDTEETAGQAAANRQADVLILSAEERLADAARKFVERGMSHAVVLDARTAHPVGILSTLDVAAAYAGD